MLTPEFPARESSPANRERLYASLTALGDFYPLQPALSVANVMKSLKMFAADWQVYNPAKPGYRRTGLSLTSLDGGLSGVPDLTSLKEYNQQHGLELNELSFRRLTSVYDGVPELHRFLDPFLPYLGRSHFLRFDAGGFFPYHRDAYIATDSFRLFIPFHDHPAREFVFFLHDRRLNLEPGVPYFIDTRLEHALFSLHPESTHLVLNVEVCAESVAAVFASMVKG